MSHSSVSSVETRLLLAKVIRLLSKHIGLIPHCQYPSITHLFCTEIYRLENGINCEGRFELDPSGSRWLRGNPVSTTEVEHLITSLKHKNKADGDLRKHSRPMSIQHMQKIHEYIGRVCPKKRPDMTSEEWALRAKCLGFLAFATLSFNLWTRCVPLLLYEIRLTEQLARNFETMKMQFKHLEFSLKTNENLPKSYWTVSLRDRKGWQHHNEFGSPEGLQFTTLSLTI